MNTSGPWTLGFSAYLDEKWDRTSEPGCSKPQRRMVSSCSAECGGQSFGRPDMMTEGDQPLSYALWQFRLLSTINPAGVRLVPALSEPRLGMAQALSPPQAVDALVVDLQPRPTQLLVRACKLACARW